MKIAALTLSLVALTLNAGPSLASANPISTKVIIESGDVVLVQESKHIKLTKSHKDSDPVLSPDGRRVVFTRGNSQSQGPDGCAEDVKAKVELWSVTTTNPTEQRLTASADSTEPRKLKCQFRDKQFSSDSKRVYFASSGWATSGSLWVHDFKTAKTTFVQPANGYTVLSTCKDLQYKDQLAINQHRYFVFGGSYDWYWLFDSQGKNERGPIGETLDLLNEACGLK